MERLETPDREGKYTCSVTEGKTKSNMSKALFQMSKSRRRGWGYVRRQEGNGKRFQVVVYSTQQLMCEEILNSLPVYISHTIHFFCVSIYFNSYFIKNIKRIINSSSLTCSPGWLKHNLFSSLAKDHRQICVIGAGELFSVKCSLLFPSIICTPITEDESCSLKMPWNSSWRYRWQITFGVYIVLSIQVGDSKVWASQYFDAAGT